MTTATTDARIIPIGGGRYVEVYHVDGIRWETADGRMVWHRTPTGWVRIR